MLVLKILCATAGGLILIRRGLLPRRVGTTPHCPRCNYVCTGIESQRCPECGAPIAAGQLVHGERRRRLLLTLIGLVLLLVPWVVLFDVVHKLSLYPYLPTGWLLSKLDASNFESRNGAWHELERRAELPNCSGPDRKRILDRALKELSGAGDVVSPIIAQYLDKQWASGRLSKSQEEQLITNAARISLRVRGRVHQGEPLPFSLSLDICPKVSSWRSRLKVSTRFWIDDVLIRSEEPDVPFYIHHGVLDATPPLGHHRIKALVSVLTPSRLSPIELPELSADVDVTTDPLEIRKLAKPSAAAMLRFLRARFRITGSGELAGVVEAEGPLPTQLACDALVRIGGQEYPAGPVILRTEFAGSLVPLSIGPDVPVPSWPQTVDLILRSNPSLAKRTVDLDDIWDGTLVIREIKVIR